MTHAAYIVAALGNPGREYERTRHNAGFMFADLAARAWPEGSWRACGEGRCFDVRLAGGRVLLLKPGTFMNNSGQAVRALADFYKVPASAIIAVYDDMSLPLGGLRVRRDGSAGGHNGMLSIVSEMGTQEIARIRIGIGPRPPEMPGRNFVLGRFSPDEEARLVPALERGFQALTTALEKGVDEAMNRFNA